MELVDNLPGLGVPHDEGPVPRPGDDEVVLRHGEAPHLVRVAAEGVDEAAALVPDAQLVPLRGGDDEPVGEHDVRVDHGNRALGDVHGGEVAPHAAGLEGLDGGGGGVGLLASRALLLLGRRRAAEAPAAAAGGRLRLLRRRLGGRPEDEAEGAVARPRRRLHRRELLSLGDREGHPPGHPDGVRVDERRRKAQLVNLPRQLEANQAAGLCVPLAHGVVGARGGEVAVVGRREELDGALVAEEHVLALPVGEGPDAHGAVGGPGDDALPEGDHRHDLALVRKLALGAVVVALGPHLHAAVPAAGDDAAVREREHRGHGALVAPEEALALARLRVPHAHGGVHAAGEDARRAEGRRAPHLKRHESGSGRKGFLIFSFLQARRRRSRLSEGCTPGACSAWRCPRVRARAFSWCPWRADTQWPVRTSHTRRVVSHDPDTTRVVPSGQRVHTWRADRRAESLSRESGRGSGSAAAGIHARNQ